MSKFNSEEVLDFCGLSTMLDHIHPTVEIYDNLKCAVVFSEDGIAITNVTFTDLSKWVSIMFWEVFFGNLAFGIDEYNHPQYPVIGELFA